MATFPRLISTSEDLQRIPNPKDFGLDQVIHRIFSGSTDQFRDFVEEDHYLRPGDRGYDSRDDGSCVLDFAREVIEHPETNLDCIRSRQQVLEAVMAAQPLLDLVMGAKIPQEKKFSYDHEESIFRNQVERAKAYLNYMERLGETLPEDPSLAEFKDSVQKQLPKERLEELRIALRDIQAPAQLSISTQFVQRRDYYATEDYDASDAKIEVTFVSKRKRAANEEPKRHYFGRGLGIHYENIFRQVAVQVKAKTGQDLVRSGKPIDLEVIVNQETDSVTGMAKYKKLNPIKSLRALRWTYDEVVVPIELKSDSIKVDTFSHAIGSLKREEYRLFVESFGSDIAEFRQPVVELRYLALAANYFNQLREKGVPTAIPKLSDPESQTLTLKGMIEPSLLDKRSLGEIVVNDVQVDRDHTMYVITGPNNNGKTTFMDGTGIAVAMAQAGLRVVAREAIVSPKDNILTHYLSPGDLAAGESRFARELLRAKQLVKRATNYTMVLMDEPGSGTSYVDGMRWLDETVQVLWELSPTTFISTHFHNLIDTAERLPGMGNLYCVTKDSKEGGIVYTYKIEPGSSTASNGLLLAQRLEADEQGLRSILMERAGRKEIRLRK